MIGVTVGILALLAAAGSFSAWVRGRRAGFREAHRRMLALFHSSADGILMVDNRRVCTEVNAAAIAIYGRSRAELVGARMGSFDDSRLADHERWAALRAADAAPLVTKVVLPDGSSRDVELFYLGVSVVGGHLVALRDITESVRIKRSLLLAEELVENSPAAMLIIPFSDRIEPYINPTMEQMLGYSTEQWKDPEFAKSIIHPDDRDETSRKIERFTLSEDDQAEGEVRYIAADGRVVWVFFSFHMIRDEARRPLYTRGYNLDITERKQLEEQLQQGQRMEVIGQLAGDVAHEFNNLLLGVLGNSSLALDSLDETDVNLRRPLEQIQKAAERAAKLTEQMLAFGRRQILQPRILDLNEVLEDTKALLEPLLGTNVELSTSYAPAPTLVRADPARLSQAIAHLAINARDAMPKGGELALETTLVEITTESRITAWGAEPSQQCAVLVVRDTGCGMDENTAGHAFEPFFTTKEVGEGPGLGLSTVFGIVKQSGGWMDLETELGTGTTVSIYLPRMLDDAAA